MQPSKNKKCEKKNKQKTKSDIEKEMHYNHFITFRYGAAIRLSMLLLCCVYFVILLTNQSLLRGTIAIVWHYTGNLIKNTQ